MSLYWMRMTGYLLPEPAFPEGLAILLNAYFVGNDGSRSDAVINFHDFSIFLHEQTHFRDYFKVCICRI